MLRQNGLELSDSRPPHADQNWHRYEEASLLRVEGFAELHILAHFRGNLWITLTTTVTILWTVIND